MQAHAAQTAPPTATRYIGRIVTRWRVRMGKKKQVYIAWERRPGVWSMQANLFALTRSEMKAWRLTMLWMALGISGMAQRTVVLWPDGAPGAVGKQDEDGPTLTIYLPAEGRVSGAGAVICPGGAYAHLAMEKEGSEIAAWLNRQGLAGFVLKYRLGPRCDHPAQLDHAHLALRYVRG